MTTLKSQVIRVDTRYAAWITAAAKRHGLTLVQYTRKLYHRHQRAVIRARAALEVSRVVPRA